MVSLQTNDRLSLWPVLNFTNSPRSPCVIRKQKHLLIKPDPKLPYKQERKYERKNKKRNKKKDWKRCILSNPDHDKLLVFSKTHRPGQQAEVPSFCAAICCQWWYSLHCRSGSASNREGLNVLSSVHTPRLDIRTTFLLKILFVESNQYCWKNHLPTAAQDYFWLRKKCPGIRTESKPFFHGDLEDFSKINLMLQKIIIVVVLH